FCCELEPGRPCGYLSRRSSQGGLSSGRSRAVPGGPSVDNAALMAFGSHRGEYPGERTMTKAVRVHKVGGPEVLTYENVEVPAPGPGEVRIRQHAVGLNFIDVYFRTGLYKAPGLPFIAGNEAAGEVLSVGSGVTNFHPGDRVAYYFNLGGYATERNIP